MTFIRRTLCIAKREFRSYFNSPIAYIVISVFLLLSGWFFFTPLFLIGRSTLRGFFSFTPILFIMFIPAITMRLIAEEVKTGTLEWLTSMPLRDLDVVLGKFLAALGLIAVALAMTIPYPISVDMVGALDWGPVIGGYVGLLLLAGAFLAVGLFASSLTERDAPRASQSGRDVPQTDTRDCVDRGSTHAIRTPNTVHRKTRVPELL